MQLIVQSFLAKENLFHKLQSPKKSTLKKAIDMLKKDGYDVAAPGIQKIDNLDLYKVELFGLYHRKYKTVPLSSHQRVLTSIGIPKLLIHHKNEKVIATYFSFFEMSKSRMKTLQRMR